MADSFWEGLLAWEDREWLIYCEEAEKVQARDEYEARLNSRSLVASQPQKSDWQRNHDERFEGYTPEDWKQEHESQQLEVLRMRS